MKLKTIILSAIAVIGMATPAFAKTNKVNSTDNNVSPDTEQIAEHDMNVYGANYTDGDKFDGLTRKVGFDRMIPPHALEVCYNKTTHIIFPAEITYVDLGNENLVAGLADGAKNVLRVKSAFKSFKQETNLSVITEDGSYYTFNVKFAKEPLLLSIEMTDFLHDGEAVNRPNNAQEIYLEKLGSESPMLVKLIMKSIYKQNKREIKHIGSKRFGVQFLLTRRLSSEPPCRNRYLNRSAPRTMLRWCMANRLNAQCSLWINSQFLTTSSSLLRSPRRKAVGTSPSWSITRIL